MMVKKLLVVAAVLVLVMAGAYGYLTFAFNTNTSQAKRIADSIALRSQSYYLWVEAGTFDYDKERAALNDAQRQYRAISQWAIRKSAQDAFDSNYAEAEEALERARRW